MQAPAPSSGGGSSAGTVIVCLLIAAAVAGVAFYYRRHGRLPLVALVGALRRRRQPLPMSFDSTTVARRWPQ